MTSVSSTYSMTFGFQRNIETLKKELGHLQNEISTGRKSDLAADLGSRLRLCINMHSQSMNLARFIENNKLHGARLEITQSSLESVHENAEQFKSLLILSQNNTREPAFISSQASRFLSLFTSALNNTFDNRYVFAGEKINITPLNNFITEPASIAKSQIDAAFSSNPPDGFGFSQTSAMVSSITSQQLETFINGPLASFFSADQWMTNWSNASSGSLKNKISPNQEIDTSVTSNDPALRKIAMAYVMASNLGVENMNPNTYQTLLRLTNGILDEGIKLLTSTRTQVGVMQQYLQGTNDALQGKSQSLEIQISEFESVNRTEIAARINSLMGQIEASYTLTSRISNLSLVRFL